MSKSRDKQPASQRRRRVLNQAGASKENLKPDEAWIENAEKLAREDAKSGNSPIPVLLIAALLVTSALAVVVLVVSKREEDKPTVSDASPSDYFASPIAIRDFARSFAYNTDPDHRLSLSRYPEATAIHLPSYLPSGRDGMVESLRSLGHLMGADPPRSGFVATMEDGGKRLLVVVETDGELKIDWDTFARHCTTPWADLFSGRAQQSDARVFAKRDDYYPEPFDETLWMSFSLQNLDADRAMYGFIRRGSPDADRLSAITENAPPFGMRVILKLTSEGGSERRHLFQIEAMLHDDWVIP